MTHRHHHRGHRWIRRCALILLQMLLVEGVAIAASSVDHFTFTSYSPLVSYTVNQVLSFRVEARDLSNQLVGTFSDTVTIGLYKYDTVGDPVPELSDPAAIITMADSTTHDGIAIVPFVNGVAQFTILLKTGSDGESVMVRHATIPPGIMGPYAVVGWTRTFYPLDPNGDTSGVVPPQFDPLVSEAASVLGPTQEVYLPQTSGPIGSYAYAVTGFSGGYSSGGGIIVPNLRVRRSSGTTPTQVRYRIILDYDGDLADYDDPQPEDTVYETTTPQDVTGSIVLSPGSLNASYAPYANQMQNGKVILRIWKQGTSQVAFTVKAPDAGTLSWIQVPYSDSNIRPILAHLEPKTHLISSPVTLYYVFENRADRALAVGRFMVPANPGGTGTPWTLTALPTARSGAVVTYSNPSGTVDGWVNVDWSSSPLNPSDSDTVTMAMTAPSTALAGWSFPLTLTNDSGAVSILNDSSDAMDLVTLGAPSAPASLVAAPLDYDSVGGAVTLAWTQVTDQQCLGYVLERRSPAGVGSFSPAVTLVPNTVLGYRDPVANMVSYEYRIRSFNTVAQSAPVTGAPVTAFVNLPAPTGLAAYSGSSSVSLAWNPVTAGPENFPVAGYEVYRGLTAGVYGATPVGTTTTNSWTDSGAVNGIRFYYVVRAVDDQHGASSPVSFHESRPSNMAQGYPPGNPPTGLSGTLSAPTSITLTWTAPVSNVSAPLSYVVYRGVNADPVVPADALTAIAAPAASYGDADSLAFGNNYRYRVAAVISGGVTTNVSNTVTVFVRPSAPSGFAAAGTSSGVTLAWTPVTLQGVTQYRVYRDHAPLTVLAGESTSGFADNTAAAGTNYLYYVTSENSGGESAHSVTILSARLPAAPTALTAVSGPGRSVTLSWTASSQANVDGYDLYRNTTASFGGATPVTTGYWGAVTLVDAGALSSGTTYFYYLQYRNPGGVSNAFGATGLMIPPTAPTGLSATPSGAAVTLDWTPNAPAENVTQYRLYRSTSPNPAVSGTVIATPTAPPFADTTALPGSSYYYAVAAVNGGTYPGGVGAPSAEVALTVPPSVPTGRNAFSGLSSSSSAVSIVWNAVGGQGVTAYALYRATAPTGPFAPLTLVASTATNYVDLTAVEATVYHYLIHSVAAGTESVSLAANAVAVTAYRQPNVPAGLTAVAGNGSVSLAWNATAATTYPVAFYEVLRDTQASLASAVTVGTPSVATLTDTGLANGTRYYYALRAVDTEGHRSAASSPVSEMPVVPPGAPATLIANNGDDQILLDWYPAAPGTRPVSYYVVSRSSAPGGPFTAAATVFAPLHWYVDATPGNGVTVYYEVRAYDDSGFTSGTHAGNASTVAQADTSVLYVNPPTDLVATAAGTTLVRLSWSAPVTGAKTLSAIRIYRSGSPAGPWILVGTAPPGALGHDDSAGLSPGTLYYYAVRSVEQGTGVESTNSNVASATTSASTRPVPPVASGQAALDANLVRISSGEKLGIHFRLSAPANVEIRILNVAGDLVSRIHYGPAPAGPSLNAEWDLRDRFGSPVSSGGYLVEISAGPLHQVLKVAVLR